jgi:hypothetical protein
MTPIPGAGDGPAADPLATVHALLAAENAHDVEAAVALFAPDATVTLALETRRGTAEIRAWQRELAEGHFHMEVLGTPEVAGDGVRFHNRLDLDLFKQMGLGTVEGISEAQVRDTKITAYTFALTPESLARLQTAASRS